MPNSYDPARGITYFNAMIGRALRRRGWKLVEDQGYRYWSTKRFERRAADASH